jgi:hypothetical protein
MIELIPIEVECHSGYKADEYPKCIIWDDKRFDVAEIADRWYQGDTNPEFPVSNYFKVLTADGGHYIIKHELTDDKWYLCLASD